jgi:hypothetical protein
MVPFRTFSILDFLADLLQKSISVASNLFACCVFSVRNNYLRKTLQVHIYLHYNIDFTLWTTGFCYHVINSFQSFGDTCCW